MFWSREFRIGDDTINAEIWSRSPDLQREVQLPSEALTAGVGAQQAMLLVNRVLPWVPDIVGRNWQDADSILVVGSAYAPFVEGSAGRSCSMSLVAYEQADSWQSFQQAFTDAVVEPDNSYYAPISALAGATATPDNCSRLAVFDLARVSFVEQDGRGAVRGGDAVVGRHCDLYQRYIEHPQNQNWLWRRLTGTKACRIVALGTIAEHGLLRMFDRQRCELRVDGVAKRLPASANGTWVKRYAAAEHKLSWWAESGHWWDIRTTHLAEERRWRLLPVPHPSAYGTRDGYARERELLAKMFSLAA